MNNNNMSQCHIINGEKKVNKFRFNQGDFYKIN